MTFSEITSIKSLCVAVGTCGGALLGGWDTILQALVALMVLDYITGVSAAFSANRLNSKIGLRGIIRKVTMLLVVMMAGFLDLGLGLQEPLLRTVVIMFFIANEGLSMLENAAAIGVPIPKRLVEALEALKEKGG